MRIKITKFPGGFHLKRTELKTPFFILDRNGPCRICRLVCTLSTTDCIKECFSWKVLEKKINLRAERMFTSLQGSRV